MAIHPIFRDLVIAIRIPMDWWPSNMTSRWSASHVHWQEVKGKDILTKQGIQRYPEVSRATENQPRSNSIPLFTNVYILFTSCLGFRTLFLEPQNSSEERGLRRPKERSLPHEVRLRRPGVEKNTKSQVGRAGYMAYLDCVFCNGVVPSK